jgi:hypothetical protein
MIAFSLLCILALLFFVGLLISSYFCYHAQSVDGQFGFAIITILFICGFVACTINAVIRADALDKEPGIHIEIKR